MRSNLARYVVAVLAAVVFSGCYSNGRWSAPNLAFWKTSPFQSASVAAPGPVGSPVKPSGIAASSTTAPPANYVATTPPVTAQGTVMGNESPTAAYPTTGQTPYTAPAAAGVAAGTTSPSGYGPTYTASTAGVPGAGAYGTPTSSGPYGSTGSTASPYNSGASPYGGANAATAAPTGYGSAGASYDSANPVRSATTYPTAGAENGAPETQGSYNYNPAANGYGASPYTAGGNTDPYAGASVPSTPSYDAGSGSGYPAENAPRYGQTGSSPYGSTPSGLETSRYATPGSANATPTGGSRYILPPTAAAGANPYEQPYTATQTGGTDYSTPSTDATSAAQAANPYAPPGGFPVSPTGADADRWPAYRPGSTSDYAPQNDAGGSASGSAYPATNVSPGVSPASYTPGYAPYNTGTGM